MKVHTEFGGQIDAGGSTASTDESIDKLADRTQPDGTLPAKGVGRPLVLLYATSVLLALAILFVDMPREAVGLGVIVLMVILLLIGVPIAVGMLASSMVGMWSLVGYAPMASTLRETVFNSSASWSMSVIPSFILMGIILWRSGITDRVFEALRNWLGWLPGGLAVSTTFAGASLASVSGSTISVTYALGKVALPSMLKAKYSPSLATGTVSAVGTLGALIPPSILSVIYAGVAQTPVGPQLLAPVIPALILAIGYTAMIILRGALRPNDAPKQTIESSLGERFASLKNLIPIVIVFGGVIGGIYLGVFTPTEAAAFGVVSAVVVALLFNHDFRRSPRKFLHMLWQSSVEAIVSTATIFVLLIAVYVLTRVITLSQLSSGFARWVVDMDLGRVQFLLVLIVVYLILGMVLDPLAMILLTVPILAGPLEAMDINLIWFGVFILIMGEVAHISPPVGMMSFIVHKIAKDPEVNFGQRISIGTVFKGSLWFVAVSLVVILMLIAWPELAMFLPESSSS